MKTIIIRNRLLPLPLIAAFGLMLPPVLQAQFSYRTDNNTITIIGYTGPAGDVSIPSSINGLPVVSISEEAFFYNLGLTNVVIPDTVTSIGSNSFGECGSLVSVTIPNSVTNIGYAAFTLCSSLTNAIIPSAVTSIERYTFYNCISLSSVTIPDSIVSIAAAAFEGAGLTSVTIPSSVTNIDEEAFTGNKLTTFTVDVSNPAYSSVSGVLFNKSQTALVQWPGGEANNNYTVPDGITSVGGSAFELCTNLNNVIIPNSVTNIGEYAFFSCYRLIGVYFQGNAPRAASGAFSFGATAYYLPGTTGWGTNFAGLPTALWYPQVQASDTSFGVLTNQFGFNINWASGLSVVVEASTSLANPIWSPVTTNLLSGGTFYFSDPQWTNYPSRFYRIRSL